jgi:hypothetical protein
LFKPFKSKSFKCYNPKYALGTVLYTHYAYDLILASLILLAAMLGSIALTLSKFVRLRQQIYEQNLRDFKQTIVKHR